NKELTILLGRLLEVADKLLKLISHDIKRIAEVTELRSTGNGDPLGKIARRNAMSTAGQLTNRVSQLLRKEDTDEDRQERSNKTYPHRLPTHVCYGGKRCDFVLYGDYA